MSNQTLPRSCVSVRIDKPADSGVIIAALEVVQAGFGVVDIAPVAQGIVHTEGGGHTAGGAQEPAPGVVGIAHNFVAVTVRIVTTLLLQFWYINP